MGHRIADSDCAQCTVPTPAKKRTIRYSPLHARPTWSHVHLLCFCWDGLTTTTPMNITQRRISSMNNSEISYQSPSDSSEMDPSITINVGDNNESNSVLSSNYDNSKRVRRDSSFASLVSEQAHQTLIRARTPAEIVSSVYNDMSWSILRGFGISFLTFFVGVHGPKAWVLPLMGGLTWRPIPYQITNNGDVLLDLGLANELIPKSDVTFPCKSLFVMFIFVPCCHISYNLLQSSFIQLLAFTSYHFGLH